VTPLRDEGRLESWGEIANYLGRSISTVQRWEKKEELPIHRHLHEKSDSVFAYRHEIESWRKSRRAAAEPTPNPAARAVDPQLAQERLSKADGASRPAEIPGVPKSWLVALASAMAVLVVALALTLYGMAILAFVISGVFVAVGYSYLRDTIFARTCVALFMIAAMSFIPSAWTMPEVMATVINIQTLKPALVYPFVTGLRFVPIPALVLGYWVVLGLHGDAGFLQRPKLGKVYVILGILFVLITFVAIVMHYGDDHIWRARLPGREVLLAGYCGVFAMNVAIGWQGYAFFKKDVIASYRPLFAVCAMAYLVLSVPAVLVDWQYNQINKHYLDLRRSEAFMVSRPDAIADLDRMGPTVARQIGQDLRSLLRDPAFARALHTKRFYKQNYDEPFQVLATAAMYGYESDGLQKPPIFVIIRMPDELVQALRFQSVGEQ
jgi:hypothetical protein